MKWIILIILAALLTGCARHEIIIVYENVSISPIINTVLNNRTQDRGCTYNGVYPDYDCSPGAIFPNATKEVICVSGYTKMVRDVPESLKKKVYESYGIYNRQPYEYEMDHIISLELGGSNDIANLYPEKYNQTNGARDKDKIENLFHRMVCNGSMTLQEAQYHILYNWTEWT